MASEREKTGNRIGNRMVTGLTWLLPFFVNGVTTPFYSEINMNPLFVFQSLSG